MVDAALVILGKGDDPGFWNGDAKSEGDTLGSCDPEPPCPGAQRGGAGQQRGPDKLPAARYEQGEAAIALVAVVGVMGQWKGAKQLGIERLASVSGRLSLRHHRAATIASGSEVIGADSSINGAAKL
jgi:hypothetical protein